MRFRSVNCSVSAYDVHTVYLSACKRDQKFKPTISPTIDQKERYDDATSHFEKLNFWILAFDFYLKEGTPKDCFAN